MRYARAIVLTAIAAALVAGCGDNDPTGPEPNAAEFDCSGVVAPGDRIEIKNISGDVKVSFTSGSEAVVHAIKTGRDSDLTSVTIEVVRHEDGVTHSATSAG